MQVKIADSSGFCYGVRRAISLAEDSAKEYGRVYSLGSLIHNEDEIKRLSKFGVEAIPDKIDQRFPILIRSHGEKKENVLHYQSNDYLIVDATCPYVKRIHELISEYSENGYSIILIGDKNHPEVQASATYSLTDVFFLTRVEEVEDLPRNKKYLVVAQTTLKEETYEEILKALDTKEYSFVNINTICSATKKRQAAVKELAKEADAMIIIGGKNSSNSRKLYEIAKEINKNSYFIENKSELVVKNFQKCDMIGVSAGASTPEWIIKEIVDKLLYESEE